MGGSDKKSSKFRWKWMVTGVRGRGSTEIGCPQLTSIRVIRVQTVFEASVWFCYKCSRLVSGSAIGVPDRCLVQLGTRL